MAAMSSSPPAASSGPTATFASTAPDRSKGDARRAKRMTIGLYRTQSADSTFLTTALDVGDEAAAGGIPTAGAPGCATTWRRSMGPVVQKMASVPLASSRLGQDSSSEEEEAPALSAPGILSAPGLLQAEKHIRKTRKQKIEKILLRNPVALLAVCSLSKAADFGIALATRLSAAPLSVLVVALACVKAEVEQCDAIALLLRGQTVNTRVLGTLVNLSGKRYVQALLKPQLAAMVASGASFEIDPAREPDQEQRIKNQVALQDAAASLMQAICESVPQVPPLVAIVVRELYIATKSKFRGKQDFSVSGLFILRFVVPALTMPDKWDIVTECSRDLRRNLMILSKMVQNIYNQAVHVKEAWMQPMLPFVHMHLDEVTRLSARFFEPADSLRGKELEKELRKLAVSKSDWGKAAMEVHLGVSYGIEELKEYLREFAADEAMQRRVRDVVDKANRLMGVQTEFSAAQHYEEILAWTVGHQGLDALSAAATEQFEMPMLAALTAISLQPLAELDEFKSCLLRIKKPCGQVVAVTVPAEEFDAKRVQREIKEQVADIQKVVYTKDGARHTLTFASFRHFEGSGVVRKRTAVFKLEVIAKADANLRSFLSKR